MVDMAGVDAVGHATDEHWDIAASAPALALSRTHVADWASVVLLAIVGGLVLATFQDYAITNDEWIQHEYGRRIVAYYKSGFADRSLFHLDNLYLYGGLFDIAAVLLAPLLSLDPYELRHLLSATCGLAGLGAVIATARLVGGPLAGFVAGLVLAVTGSWYGTMFHHTKDIPLAAAMAGALFFLVRASQDLPKPQLRHVLGFGVCAGAALGIKVMALLMICYIPVALLLNSPVRPLREPIPALRFAGQSLLRFLPGIAIAYLLMIVLWPWAALSPFNFIRGLIGFSGFAYDVPTILDGTVYKLATVPRQYVPTYLLLKLPLVLLFGCVIGLIALARMRDTDEETARLRRDLALVTFAAVFPLACQIAMRGPAFCGLRHFLFVLPPLAILSGVGLALAINRFGRWHVYAGFAALGVVLACAGSNALTLARLHPYQYLVFNSAVGELPGATRRYVTDYWFTSMPETMELLERYLARTEPPSATPKTYTVGTCGERAAFEKFADPRFIWTPLWKSADFHIAPTHMSCDDNSNGLVVGMVERLGVPIGVVKDQRSPVWELGRDFRP